MCRAWSQRAALAGAGKAAASSPSVSLPAQHIGSDTQMEIGSCVLLGAGKDLKLSSGVG